MPFPTRSAAALALTFLAGGVTGARLAPARQAPPPVVAVDYMRVPAGGEEAYVRMETEVWRPIHEATVEAGLMEDWTLYRVQFPSGTDAPYGFVTVNVYESWAQYERAREELPGLAARVHPDRSWDELGAEANATRAWVSEEIWRPIADLD